MTAQTQIPDGYMKNAAGHLVPKDQVREQDLLRDEVARKHATRALELNAALKKFKDDVLADVADLVKISGEKYGVRLGGKKGNVTVSSYDGQFQILRAHAERVQFTEEIEAAKALVDACIMRWGEGANANMRVVVDRVFRTDSKGQLKTSALLEFMRSEIDDPEWDAAMQALRDSLQVVGTSVYVRIYQRVGASDQYKPIVLDLAAV